MKKSFQKCIAIVGPTAVGKSSLAIALARKYNGEIISADSRQVYAGLDIGTGKTTIKEMAGVPHHLLDVVNPKKQYSAAEFQKLGKEKITDILSRGKLPIICGGTGLYVDSLLTNNQFPEVPPNEKLRAKLDTKTTMELFQMLKRLDPRRAKTIDPHNPRRLVRAIEIATALGKVPPLELQTTSYKPLTTLWIGLMLPPEELKKRIADRLEKRLKTGMVQEAKRLHARGLSWKRMEELGLEYRYLARFLQKQITKEEMITSLQSEIRHYAKRQIVWFKRNTEIQWFAPRDTTKIKMLVRNFLRA